MNKQDRKTQERKELEQEKKAILAIIKQTGFSPGIRNLKKRLEKIEARLKEVG